MSLYPRFDLQALSIQPLARRRNDLDIDSALLPLKTASYSDPAFHACATALGKARQSGSARILMIGAHVLRRGCQRYLASLMENGFISCLAVNGACAIHDYEFARIGATTESVARYIREGQFGLWKETGELNDIVRAGADEGLGAGEAIGRALARSGYPYAQYSVFAIAHKLGIPVTTHVGIGYDIICEHPNYDGAAWGRASHVDFLIFAQAVRALESGVVMNFGSAIMAPEVFLKALAMARNVERREKRRIAHFTTLVCDLHDLPGSFRDEVPKDSAAYYFRPWKTMLVRTVADGGESHYVKGDHAQTIPALWTALMRHDDETTK